jgi:AcrR family transcriptional regulator
VSAAVARRTGRSGRTRRTQEERSAETRARLLDATIECLVELGYAGTTTTEVARRAGVSRGAQLHHFRTKEELVLAAVEHLFQRRNAEFIAAFARLPAGTDRPAAALDLLWKIIGANTFYAWLELAVAGRTDARLGRRVRELGSRTSVEVERTFRELFPPPAVPNPFFEQTPRFVFAVLQGLALDRLLVTAPRVQAAEVLSMMKRLSSFAFPGGTE